MAGERNVTFAQMLDYINLFAQHTPKEEGARTIIFSENRAGWLFAFYSVWQNSGVAVPVDASSMVADLEYILDDCRPACIWTSRERLAVAKEAVAHTGLNVQILIIDDYENAQCQPRGCKTHIEEDGIFTRDNNTAALIIYTSGTTGSPKGVVLSYRNLYANMHSVTIDVPIFNTQRRTLILLPLHHVLPLVGTVILPILSGGGVAICPALSGPDIMETLQRGKIAIFVGVPRLWQMLYTGIKKKIDSSPITRALFRLCEKVGSPSFSRIIFGAVHKKLGGHLTYCVSGGAALDKEIGEGLRTLGITMLEGYGMTETAPIISFTRPGDIIPGCVGKPMSTVDVRIVEGEICVKGPNVMLGYYNRPEETAQVIDRDGYVHTGDLGMLDELGRIHITGRSKEIIVLSNGKNIQPNEIEYKLEKYHDKIREVAVVQDGDLLCAIIVPQDEWADATGNVSEMEEALKRQVIEPYNRSALNYKKIMNVLVYRGDLPRTRMEKLQRYKLKDVLANARAGVDAMAEGAPAVNEPDSEEYRILKHYIETEKKVTVRPHDNLETDLAFDSLDNVGLQGFVEQTFGVEMKANTFASFRTVEEIAGRIARSKTRMEVEETDWHAIISGDSSNLQLPYTSSLFVTYARLFKAFLRMHNGLVIKGAENIPAEGQFILAPNHECYLDGPIAVAGMSSSVLRNSYFYATEEHVNSSFRRYMARHNNVIIMEQRNLKNSILKLAEVLKQGKNIVIFPEGRRTSDGSMNEFKKTFAILAKELNVPIVPVRITGAFEAMPKGSAFPNTHKISVEYLEPVVAEAGESYDALSTRVREIILGNN